MTIADNKKTGAVSPKTKRATKSERAAKELPEPERVALTPIVTKTEAKLAKLCKWETVRIHRSLIIPAKYNPRTMTANAEIGLRESLTEFGMVEDPVWNAFNGVLIAGHQRLKQIDLVEGHLDYLIDVKKVWIEDPKEERALNVRLNNRNEQGEYDAKALVEMYEAGELDLSMAGMGPSDLAIMALEQGVDDDYLNRVFSQEGLDRIAGLADNIDSLMDQSDAIKAREPKKEGSYNNEELNQDEDEFDDEEYPPDEGDENGTANRGVDLDKIKAARKLTQNMIDQAECEYFLIVGFINNEAKFQFCEQYGIPQDTAILDGGKLVKRLGFDPYVVEVPVKKGKGKE